LKRALFIKTKNLGDAVVLTAAVRALRGTHLIDILCFSDCIGLYDGIEGVGKVFGIKRGQRGIRNLLESLRILLELKRVPYDLVAHFSDDWRGAWLSRALSSTHSVARVARNRPRIWRASFKTLAPRQSPRRHMADQDVDLLRKVGLFWGETPAYCPPSSPLAIHDLSNRLNAWGFQVHQYIVVHPCSRWSFKEIKPEAWAGLISSVLERGLDVVISGSDHDSVKVGAIADLVMTPTVVAGRVADENAKRGKLKVFTGESLQAFSSLIAFSKGVAAIDSLAIHLSSAHQVPTLAVFGPSGELNWRPWNTRFVVVENSTIFPCRPCGLDGCGGGKISECLTSVSSAQLVSAAEKVFEL
jgi:heptosyltransferase-3